MTAAWVILAVLAVLGYWYADVRHHPIRRCPACKGSRTNAGSNRQRWGTCRRCGGRGEVRRLGAPRE